MSRRHRLHLLLTALCLLAALPPHTQAQSYSRPPSQTSPNYRPPPVLRPATITPARPAVVTPARPAVVTPARPATIIPARPATIIPAKPAVITPARPAVVTPAQPAVVIPAQPIPEHPAPGYPYPEYPVYPGYPVIVTPSYPSGFVGPEVIRVTTIPSAPAPQASPAPPAVPAAPAQRLVALLGRVQRLKLDHAQPPPHAPGATGDGDHLCLGFGTLVTYYDVARGKEVPALARGTFFGSRWDGDHWHTSETGVWTRGPILRQPLLSLNELRPASWPYEVARPGHRVTSMHLALVLVNDEDAEGRSPAAVGGPADRYLPMRAALSTRLARPLPAAPPADAGASAFPDTVCAGLEEIMGNRPPPQAIGQVGWTLTLDDLRQIMSACPRFDAAPAHAELLGLKTADTSGRPLPWVRTFRLTAPSSTDVIYQGEIWFLILPDTVLTQWQQPATVSR